MEPANELLRVFASEQCRSHHCEEAIGAWEQLLAGEPRNFEYLYQLGICFSGSCRLHSLIDNEIALEHLLTAAGPAEHDAPRLTHARILSALGRVCSRSSRWSATNKMRFVNECLAKAADLFLMEGRLEEWATEQNLLGQNKCKVSGEQGPSKWKEAVAHFESALSVWTPERDPEGHAMILVNLGGAYQALPEGSRSANLRKAIACFRGALAYFEPRSFPKQNALIHHDIGNALLHLPADDPSMRNRNTLAALRHFDDALRWRTKGEYPREYAWTQLSRGQAWLQLADGDARSHRQRAENCFREAVEFFKRCGEFALADQAEVLLRSAQGQPLEEESLLLAS
jgi:tetratricopeptide (TPR) repeat protein